MIKYFIGISMLIFFQTQEIFPQINLSTKLENYFDDNIYNNSNKISDIINSFSVDAGYNFESKRNNLQLYSMNNFSSYNQNSLKSSTSHKIGIVNTFLFAENDDPFNAGINYSLKYNRDELTIFDFNQISIYANYRHSLNENDFLIAGYLLNRNNYKNLSSFSYNENKFFLKYSNNLSTGTTFLFGTEIDFKNYLKKLSASTSKEGTTQMSLTANAAQFLSETSGIAAYFNFRKNLKAGTRYLLSGNLVFYEEEIFNDIYSNDGYETGFAFTQIIFHNLITKIEVSYAHKYFSNLPVANAEGIESNELRKDNLLSLGFELHSDLDNIINGLGASFIWNYFNNKSNDVFYNYDNQIYSINLEWEF